METNIICDNCGKEFILRINSVHNEDLEVKFLQCPFCNTTYPIITTDSQARTQLKINGIKRVKPTPAFQKRLIALSKQGEKILAELTKD